jgi:hypothetical protein
MISSPSMNLLIKLSHSNTSETYRIVKNDSLIDDADLDERLASLPE